MEFPKLFFCEEERSGFLIPEMMKRAWAAELEVLEALKRACRENGLQYFANAGTLLGAVRHKGYIPWDDDIDICMPRKDYEILMANFRTMLPAGFVIEGTYADEERLRDANDKIQSRIIADEYYFSLPEFMTYFHGYPFQRVGIDIFPYDYMPADLDKQYELMYVYHQAYFTDANWELFREQGKLKEQLKGLQGYLGGDFSGENEKEVRNSLRRAAEKWIAQVDESEGVYITNAQTRGFGKSKEQFKGYRKERKEWYSESVELPFENTMIDAPVEYEAVVKEIYGQDCLTNYKKYAASHEYPFYKNKEPEMKRLLEESGITLSLEEFCRNWHEMNGGK